MADYSNFTFKAKRISFNTKKLFNRERWKIFSYIRRNIIKGRDRLVAHKISEDYTLNTYEITNSLASEIKTYLKLTENNNSTKLDTLFVTDPHYNRWGRRTGVNNRFLTYTNLNTILRYFLMRLFLKNTVIKLIILVFQLD